MDYQAIIDKYYPEDDDLRRLLLKHSRQVANRCLYICDQHPELLLDRQFLEESAMLHDIGIRWCNAPSIYCHGTEPYICHGFIGGQVLRREGWERHARVCERHTGTGLTREQIISQHLPLPLDPYPSNYAPQPLLSPYEPEALEEQLVCYADKFYSKSRPDSSLTVVQAAESLERFGHEGVDRFLGWAEIFE
jgi:uncharacterized protein